MKIAYLISQYPAPSHTFIRREIEALRRRGLTIETASIRPAESLSDADRKEEAQTFYVLPASAFAILRALIATFMRRPGGFIGTLYHTLGHRLPGLKNWVWSLFYFVEAMRLAESLEKKGVSHLHNHFANAASHVGLATSRFLGISWSLSLHGLGDFDGPTLPLLPDKVAAARFVASVTHYGRGQVMRLTDPSEWDKVFVVRCGIDAKAIAETPSKKAQAPGARLKILCVGRLSPEKGQVGLVDAFAIATAAGLDAELVLIGGGPDERRVMQQVTRHGLEHRITLHGRQPEAKVLEAMANADFLVLPSFMEGLPVVLMEALALGCPVIAPAITGIPELVVHGETGLTFPAGDFETLAARMATLAADPELRTRLAAAGKQRVLESFDCETAVEPLYQHYVQLGTAGQNAPA